MTLCRFAIVAGFGFAWTVCVQHGPDATVLLCHDKDIVTRPQQRNRAIRGISARSLDDLLTRDLTTRCLQLCTRRRNNSIVNARACTCQVSMTLDNPAGTELKLEGIKLTTSYEGSVLGDYASPRPASRLRSVQL